MKLLDIRVYQGRNIYSHGPVVRMDVDLEEMVDVPTCEIHGFNQQLLAMLPGLKSHKCSKAYPGGLVERLETGTYLAHVIEHVALEIQGLAGYSLNFGKTRYLEKETVYTIVYSYENEFAGMEAGRIAFDLVLALINRESYMLDKALLALRHHVAEKSLGPSTAAIAQVARKLKIPVIPLGEGSLLQLGYGKFSRRIQATLTDRTSCIAVDMAGDKELTKRILRERGIPVPKGNGAETETEALRAAGLLGYPVVVKPNSGNQGKGVSLNLNTAAEVRKGFQIAQAFSRRVLVEEYIPGQHYRIAVVGDQMAAAAQRVAAHVVGNGKDSIRALIDRENQNPLRGEDHEKPLTKIKVDDVMLLLLEKSKRSLEEIPPAGEVVFLRENDNLSTGGTAIDVTDQVHPVNRMLAIRAARAIGLDVAGVDMTTGDISKPITENGGAIIEVNACPGIRMHHYPSVGRSRNVAGAIVRQLFPDGSRHSIPIAAVTGTNGKTTTVRMLSRMLRNSGQMVGMTSTGGIYIGDELILSGDTTGPKSAQIVLTDKRVEAAVLETARGGIVNRGLGYDLADVGIITNIRDDHLGIDGINTLEEMAYVKGLVVEALQPEGYAVLNAEDPYTPQLAAYVRCNLIYFSTDPTHPCLKQHMEEGKPAVYVEANKVWIFNGSKRRMLLKVEEIASSLGGILKHNIENSLSAAAGAYAMGVDPGLIAQTLREFQADTEYNPGRFNIFSVNDFRVVVDYGHNLDGYSRVLSAAKLMKTGRLIGVIGVPGDRNDLSILKLGEVSGKYFDQVYIKEDGDLRGREPEEVARLLKRGCLLSGMGEDKIVLERQEVLALERAMGLAREGDLIVVFYEKLEPLIDLIRAYQRKKVPGKKLRVSLSGTSS